MKMLSLFSGIGGIDLAAEWAGVETVAFCEIEPFCQKVLQKHWPDVPIFDDVRKLTRESLEERGIEVDSIGIISAGYPCQPFSYAGDRKGETDDRHLWPEVNRLLKEIRPTWFIGENVAGHVTLGIDTVLSDLENKNYSCQSFIIPACGVNAPHRRNRVFIVAYTEGEQSTANIERETSIEEQRESERMGGEANLLSNPTGFRLQGQGQPVKCCNTEKDTKRKTSEPFDVCINKEWEVEPDMGRVVDGVSDRFHKDRLKALGNAVVPQQIYPIFKAIMEIEGGKLI